MLAVIQRVANACVRVEDKVIGEIQQGILSLIGIEKADTLIQAEKLLDRILSYRIFEDTQEKMNLSIQDIKGGLLLVPQFTLVADTHKGTRPGFSTAMPPVQSQALFEAFVQIAQQKYPFIQTGKFGANMQVSLCNDGPVTFLLKA